MRYAAVVLVAVMMSGAVLLSDGSSADVSTDEYVCFGDLVHMDYSGGDADVSWKVTDMSGKVLQEYDGEEWDFNASAYDSILVTQTVTTESGSNVETVKVMLKHLTTEQFFVTFYYDVGGDVVDMENFNAHTVCSNGVYTELPSNPLKEGKSFGGWYTLDGDERVAFDEFTAVDGNMDVYADWKDIFPVIMVSNGIVCSMQYIVEGDSCELVVPDPVKGRSFAGYYTEPEYINSFDPGSAISSETYLYAKWVDSGDGGKDLMSEMMAVMLIMAVLAVLGLVTVRLRRKHGARSSSRRFHHI